MNEAKHAEIRRRQVMNKVKLAEFRESIENTRVYKVLEGQVWQSS